MSDLKAAALGAFGFAAMTTDKAFEGFDQSNAFTCPDEGGNHAAWVAGHLAQTYAWVLDRYAGEGGLDPALKDLFGGGSEPKEDPAVYPPFDELMATMKDRRQAFTDWFSALPEEKAAELLDEEARMFGQTFAGMVGAMGAHENYHAGQLSVVRKKLGMARIFG